MAALAVRRGVAAQWDPEVESVAGWKRAWGRTYVAWQRDLASGRQEEATEKLYQLCRGLVKAGPEGVREDALMQRFLAGVAGERQELGQRVGMSMRV